ncbi:hypothetical protein [Streptomyces sp. NPDC002952]
MQIADVIGLTKAKARAAVRSDQRLVPISAFSSAKKRSAVASP